MKTTYLTSGRRSGSSLSFAASINGMDSSYSKGYTIYDGSNGDTLNVSSPPCRAYRLGATPWTMALTISDLGTTSGTDVGCCLPTIPPLITIWKEWAISWRRRNLTLTRRL
ncbi:MAG: hypothetical protein ACLT8E_01175 [Akkermansia sp.]